MRLLLNIELAKEELPVEYHSFFLSFLKNSLENYSPELKKMLYDGPYFKEITFSAFINSKKFEKDIIILKNNNIKIIFSIFDDLLGLHFFNAFLYILNKEISYKGYNLTLKNVIRIKEKKIESDEVLFKILSPVVIREKISEKESKYLMLDSSEGIKVLKENMERTLEKRFPLKNLQELQIEPLEIKKVIVKFYKIKMQCSLGYIKVKGKKEILNYLYKAGFSTSRRGLGFNTVDIVEEGYNCLQN